MGMLGFVSRASLLLAVCVAGLAFYLHTPLPADIDQPGLARLMSAANKMEALVEPLFLLFWSYKDRFRVKHLFIKTILPSPKLDKDPDLQVTDEVFDGVQVRVYRPVSAAVPTPAVVYFHGGGWCWGSLDFEDAYTRLLSREAQLVVISVEYRLAPEHPFPAPLHDCVMATKYVLTHSLELGINSKKVGVAGLSAGGNLAAAVALRLQETQFLSLPRLLFQVLLMPALQSTSYDLPSYRENDPLTGWVLSREAVAMYSLAYAGLDFESSAVAQVVRNQHISMETRGRVTRYVDSVLVENSTGRREEEEKKKKKKKGRGTGGEVNATLARLSEPLFTNPFFSPLLADDEQLRQLPPAAVVVSQFDVLRDDGLLYAQRLRQAGVPVVSHLVNKGHHLAILGAGEQDAPNGGRKALLTVLQFIRKMVAD